MERPCVFSRKRRGLKRRGRKRRGKRNSRSGAKKLFHCCCSPPCDQSSTSKRSHSLCVSTNSSNALSRQQKFCFFCCRSFRFYPPFFVFCSGFQDMGAPLAQCRPRNHHHQPVNPRPKSPFPSSTKLPDSLLSSNVSCRPWMRWKIICFGLSCKK